MASEPDLLAIRRISAEPAQLAPVRRFLQEALAALSFGEEARDDLTLAVDEAVTNVIAHGYRGRPGEIEVALMIVGENLQIRLIDNAPPFDPTGVPPPDLSRPLHERPLGGMGIHLIRQAVDELAYTPLPGGNQLVLTRRLPEDPDRR